MTTLTAAAIDSVPALAAALRTTGRGRFVLPARGSLAAHSLATMYCVRGSSTASEVGDAVHLIEEVVDRLRRLAGAYGAWREFDAGAYFDLTEPQAQALVRVTERVNTVHVLFRTDLLLPTFGDAAAYWAGHFSAAHAASRSSHDSASPNLAFDDDFLLDTQPAMKTRWQRLLTIIGEVRSVLADDPAFWGMSATQEAQMGLRHFWTNPPAPGIDPALTPALNETPTLTLAYDFPLPAHRQSGRTRRLRLNRERRRKRAKRSTFRENPT